MSDTAALGIAATALVQGVNPETQVVRLVNVGDTAFIGQYANVTYEIQPGQSIFAPFLAMCLWLGHPDAVDIDAQRKYRHDEFMRLNARYGAYDSLDAWEEMKPQVEAYDVEGKRLITVVDDYLGDHLRPETSSVQEKAQMLAAMAAMQSQMAAMQAQIERFERGEQAIDASDLVTNEKVAAPEGEGESSPEVTIDRPKRVVVS